jgi:hypothetical protein
VTVDLSNGPSKLKCRRPASDVTSQHMPGPQVTWLKPATRPCLSMAPMKTRW